ncbi:MAG: FecR domain-containing protein [Bacteroidota bacterium]
MNNWKKDDTFLSKWLNNELSDAEKEAFESSQDGIEFLKLIEATEELKAPEYDIHRELSELKNKISSSTAAPKKTIFMQPVFRLAVAAALLLAVTLTYLLTNSGTTISTGLSEQEIVVLPDGTEVKLNANSTLTYDEKKWPQNRRVKLSGEAFFNVTSGNTFSIITETGITTVLGTSFNVKSRLETLDVFCFTGKVRVTVNEESINLNPGMTVRFTGPDLIKAETKSVDDGPSWMNGITNLEDVPLPVALAELKHIFGVSIEYDGSLDSVIYNGAFPHEKPEAAFKLVLDNLGLDYSYDSDTRLLKVIGPNP